MDWFLSKFPHTHAFIDNIFVITKGTEKDYLGTVEKILKKLDKGNMSLKLTKCKFARKQCEWLEHKIATTGVTPLVLKTEPVESLKPPGSLSQLKFFMPSTHSLYKGLPPSLSLPHLCDHFEQK